MKKRGGVSVWDILLWLGAIIILVWAFLKAFGIIHSPVWVEMIPYIGGGLSLLGGAYQLGKIMHRVENTDKKMNSVLRMKDDFLEVRNNQKLCLGGRLNKSPYGKG